MHRCSSSMMNPQYSPGYNLHYCLCDRRERYFSKLKAGNPKECHLFMDGYFKMLNMHARKCRSRFSGCRWTVSQRSDPKSFNLEDVA
ncbi:hypothetical protein RRG08_002218 [Elysia crispata]|uniref:Uncharacterized protein n=1 Tax=Elysia crispata TaxID=231223 RepID=A0AAE1DDJ0_9GAST|nr:hypothetical protein RRG08_002218 [Elysia crispata]